MRGAEQQTSASLSKWVLFAYEVEPARRRNIDDGLECVEVEHGEKRFVFAMIRLRLRLAGQTVSPFFLLIREVFLEVPLCIRGTPIPRARGMLLETGVPRHGNTCGQ